MSETKIPLRRSPTDGVTPLPEQPTYPTETIPLPTRGWFYPENSPLSKGEVEVKQMSAREEDILANVELIRKGKVLDRLISSLIVDKSIDTKEILAPDKDAIFIGIRRLAYGDTYPVSVVCPNCSTKNRVDINLAELKESSVDTTKYTRGQNTFEFVLPKSKRRVSYKLLNQYDNDKLEAELTAMRKVSKESSGVLTTRLKHVIVAVDGDVDQETIRRFIDNELLAIDARALREHIKVNTPGIVMEFDFQCEKCDAERRMDIPMGASFLWPDIEA